ncbi:hypothetical protein VDG1235_3914 [Verrucomicrobiia bacterium DG1235]|nr:hypothetical protein VDG1235_3914 [Verrucomicrobiae bacterium DG1235]
MPKERPRLSDPRVMVAKQPWLLPSGISDGMIHFHGERA